MRTALKTAFVAAAAVGAAVLAWRLSADALALIAGVFLGTLLILPALLISLWALRRAQPAPPAAYYQQAPPVIVVQPAAPALPTPAAGQLPLTALPDRAADRRWTMRVYGEEELAATAETTAWPD